jgi:DNA-binding NarL/FixJ family response regulator
MATRSRIDGLTSREVEVLRLIATGLTNREAAESLGLSVRTVDAHLRSVYAKLGVRSRSAATRFAMDQQFALTADREGLTPPTG